eukprot:m.31892 g.31892  ORF g.31892 m.31892 type:complete len:169 (+) comp31573_c0_seq2:1417-1923(+)
MEGTKFNEKRCSHFILGLLESVLSEARKFITQWKRFLTKTLDFHDSVADSCLARKTLNDCTRSMCKVASSRLRGEYLSSILMSPEKVPKIVQSDIHGRKHQRFSREVCPCGLGHSSPGRSTDKYCDRFLGSDSKSRTISYFLWPCLVDEGTHRILVKGRVVTGETKQK